MKKIILYSFLSFCFAGFSQDTLNIESVNLQWNTPSVFLFDDSLDFSYVVSKNGAQEAYVPVRTNVRVINSQVYNNIEGVVLEDTAVSNLDFSENALHTISHRLILRAAAFKNGNNTVVIWPDIEDKVSLTEDSIKFVVDVTDVESYSNSPLKELIDITTFQNNLQLLNSSSENLDLHVYNTNGKEIILAKLNSGEGDTWYLKTGVYFITTVKGNTYFVHKMIIH